MYVVIMGGGRVGLRLASFLVTAKKDVTLIEQDPKICAAAAEDLDALVICGNGSDVKTLEEANISDADIFVAATGHDETNLLASILVKDYKPDKIIARLSDPTHENAFKKIGVETVVSPELTAAGYLEKIILRPDIADLIIRGRGGAELIDLAVENKKVIGKKIGDLSPTDDYIICAVYEEDDGMIIPQKDMILKRGYRVSLLVKKDHIKKVAKMFLDI
jgi:trk system potassium uptake protein TrkA